MKKILMLCAVVMALCSCGGNKSVSVQLSSPVDGTAPRVVVFEFDGEGNLVAPIDGVLASLTAVKDSYVTNAMPVAVIDGAGGMKVTTSVAETVVYNTFKKFSGKKVSEPPFRRITFADAMLKYGSDKPDLRNPLEIKDLV